MGIVIGLLVGLVAGGALAVTALLLTGSSRIAATRRTAKLMLQEARREADAVRREAQLEAKEDAVRLRQEIDREVAERQAESVRQQERLVAQQAELDRRQTEVDRREQGVADREIHARQLQDELEGGEGRGLTSSSGCPG